MSNISKIKISGTSYNLKDENACKVVELTQAQYDDLPASAKTSNSLFVITDATAGDLSNYYTKTEADGLLDTKLDATAYTPTDLSNYYTKAETSGATEISTALESKADTATTYTKTETDNAITAATSTKQDTLVSGTNIKTINNQSILGEGNIDIQGGSGGGKSIEAGRGISITTGETADTVSINLPISAGTGTDSVLLSNGSSATGNQSCAGGQWCSANGRAAFAFGNQAHADYRSSAAFGVSCNANSNYSFVCCERNTANGDGSFACGQNNITNGDGSFACGFNSLFNTGSTDADNTLFSVGNGTGTATSTRHNALEIRRNGDIYITKDGQDVKLQDQLGGGGSITIDQSLDSGSTNAVANSAITNAINDKVSNIYRDTTNWVGSGVTSLNVSYTGGSSTIKTYCASINNKPILTGSDHTKVNKFSLVETSAITTSVTSSSTDAQVPSAKAVYDIVGNIETLLSKI